MRNRKLK